jgi:hypothetical protein
MLLFTNKDYGFNETSCVLKLDLNNNQIVTNSNDNVLKKREASKYSLVKVESSESPNKSLDNSMDVDDIDFVKDVKLSSLNTTSKKKEFFFPIVNEIVKVLKEYGSNAFNIWLEIKKKEYIDKTFCNVRDLEIVNFRFEFFVFFFIKF